jgi:long-chain acyl-CoA synthetase
MNGASGISAGIRHFLSIVLAPMLGSYSLTKSCINGALGYLLKYLPNAISPIPAAIKVKLVFIPDIRYLIDIEVP